MPSGWYSSLSTSMSNCSVAALDGEREGVVGGEQLVVDQVGRLLAIYREDLIAGLDVVAGGDAFRADGVNQRALAE